MVNSVDNKTEIVYNKAMQTVSSTDENGETSKYTYDSRYRVKTETASDKSVEYEYDSNGNVLTKKYSDILNFVNEYDSKDRIKSTTFAGKTTNYTYDSDGQLVSANDDTYAI